MRLCLISARSRRLMGHINTQIAIPLAVSFATYPVFELSCTLADSRNLGDTQPGRVNGAIPVIVGSLEQKGANERETCQGRNAVCRPRKSD